MFRKINLTTFFKALFFLVLSVFFFHMIYSGYYTNFIHIKFRYLLLFTSIVFLLISLVTFKNAFKLRIKKYSSISFVYILLPLMMFYFPKKSNNTFNFSNNIMVVDANSSDEMLKQALKQAGEMDTKVVNVEDVDNITDMENYVLKLEYLHSKDDMLDKEISISGMAFTFNVGAPKKHLIGRLLMFCCAADAMPVGLYIDLPEKYLNYTGWLEVRGKIKYGDFNGEKYIYLDSTEFKEITGDENIYVYPPALF